ncbi:uncharacterized protein LOC134294855 isoform X2 [Anolis carolinensis]|uniref:uncharacterized protein LOC103280840 isoform X2 n=1 Tax=Anolis carolinensis TaxID=28377 RepID=UPI002F2B7368
MSSVIIKEGHRLKQWGILGEGTGAHLVNKEKTRLLTKEELVGPDGAIKAHEVLRQVATTGLMVPRDDAVMLLANHSTKSVPADHFLHPDTGKVLPIAGNIGFDPISFKLIPMVDLASGELRNSAMPIFPYVPYPICPSTGLPVKSNMPVLQPEKVFQLGGFMQDPASGIEVPILAVTLHPQTGQRLTLGGTYLNPLTGTVSPLEIGAPMRDPEGGRIVPILGVALDSHTGDVLPLGGLQGPSETLLQVGDSFVEPLSGKAARAQGLCLQRGKAVPHGGGFGAVLEGNVLLSQIRAAKALQDYKESLWGDRCPAGDGQRALKAAEEDVVKALSCKMQHVVHWMQRMEKQQEWASHMKRTGGKLGMVRYPSTDLWVPAIFGMGIPDPGGSGLTVPILGVECDWRTGQPVPLAGTMEDADGKGLVPLAIGFRTIDPITGETGPVIGAQINPWTTAVIPIVQSLGSLPRGSPDPELTDALETEVAAKQRFWRGQREKEEELLKELDFLRLDILEAAKEGKMNKLRYKDKLKPAEEIYRSLEESSNQEAQRRANRQLKAPRDSKPSLQMRVKKDERDQEARVQVLLRKTLEKLVQFVRKVQLDEGRIQMQLKEVERQRSSSLQILETLQETSRKTTLHLVAAFEEHMAKHQANVERACCRLEYLRYLLETVALQTKDLHSGSSQCFVNYPSWRFYGAAGAPQGTWEVINRKLIPLLRSVLETLKESKRSPLSPEVLVGLGSEKGYSSRSTLKVSEVTGEAFRVQTRQEGVPIAAALSPSVASPKRSQLLQEIQARIVLEKHGSEMLHLELSLMAEEIHMITCFWESSRPKKNLGTNLEGSKEWDRLLKELAEYHRHSEEELCRQHSEDVKHAGFGPEGIAFQDGALFSQEEILQNLVSLHLDLQKADSSLTMEASKENNNETQIAEAKLSPAGSTSQKDQAMARKVVKQEALKQIYIHRVLDHYSNLQRKACPEEVLQALEPFCTGEMVARDVVQSVEKQQVERAVAFLQKQSQEEEDLSASCSEKDEAKLRKLQALIRMELQTQIEEKVVGQLQLPEMKLEAKETEIVLEAMKPNTSLSAHFIVCFLLSRRHLRQAVLVLEANLELQETGLKTQGDGSSVEDLALDDPLVDQNTKAVVHLLKEKKDYVYSVLQLLQASQMLQLRERQFQEMVQKLKAHSSDQHLEEADQMVRELQEFRQRKTKELEENLRTSLKSPRTQEGRSKNPNDLQSERPLLEKDHKREGKERWQSFQQTWLVELEETYRGQISEEKARLQDQLEKGELKKWSKQGPIAFEDVAVHFSLEEWVLLNPDQKALHVQIMEEIHGIVDSLGKVATMIGISVSKCSIILNHHSH